MSRRTGIEITSVLTFVKQKIEDCHKLSNDVGKMYKGTQKGML
jgi:hypothetical protein